jgi:hypothetical protein
LGQKQTCAVQQPMSALPPKADIVCDKVRIMRPVARRHIVCVAPHLRLTTLLVPVPSTTLNMCRATAAMIRRSSSA